MEVKAVMFKSIQRFTIAGALASAAIFAAACSASHSSTPPLLDLPESAIHEGMDAGPFGSVTASVVVTVPPGSAAQSISTSVNGGAPVVANITPGSPGCGGTPLVCTVSVAAPTSTDVFAFTTFSGVNGTGNALATGDVLQKITTSSYSVKITLSGTPAAIALALKKVSPRECDPASTIPLYVMVMDSSANTIIGSYGESVLLSDSDTSGKTGLSTTSLSTSSTSITVSYNGFPLMSATFSASANGVPGGAVKKATLKPMQMIYVPSYDRAIGKYAILVFPSNATGNVGPARTISGGDIGFNNDLPNGVALDGSCELYVLEPQAPLTFQPYPAQVEVFNAGANGSVSPIRSFANYGNPPVGLYITTSISLDSAGNAWIATAYAETQLPTIQEYAATANGDVTPLAVIDGPNTDLAFPTVAIGPDNKIYSAEGGDIANNVLVFAAGSNGNAKPSQSINANSNADSIGVDSAGNIYVTDGLNNNVQVYAPNATGNTPPIATISGSNTLLSIPGGMAFGYANNLFVCSDGSVLQFLSGANGNVSPHTDISGLNTLLGAPLGEPSI